MLRASVTEVARNFADYLNRVAFRGERFLLIRGGRPVAELSPVPTARTLGELAALLGALPKLSSVEAAAFNKDISAARASLRPAEDQWES